MDHKELLYASIGIISALFMSCILLLYTDQVHILKKIIKDCPIC
jgi:hypothetical protein